MADILIETIRLSKSYQMGTYVVPALVDISIAIEPGDFVAVTGPSGSGKSTLLNLLGCLDTPTAGTYRFDGADVSALDSDDLARIRNRKIGFCFQLFNLLPRSPALANVELPLLYGATDRASRKERARAALAEVGLADRTHHLPTQLSGGQQQRVAIARALVNNPLLVLADEPTGALDTRTGLEIMALLQRLNRTGLTIVLVTHDSDVVLFARRVLLLRDGRLMEDRALDTQTQAETLLSRFPPSEAT
jgi:ABC-type lipoprotein export system ATPase subunit